VKHKKN